MSDLGRLEGLAVVFDHLDAYVEGLRENALIAAGEIAAVLEAYAKREHPWTTRSGATAASILGTVIEGQDVIDIYLSAGMDYDVFLELAHSGRWAWLWPAIEANKELIRTILVRRLGYAKIA